MAFSEGGNALFLGREVTILVRLVGGLLFFVSKCWKDDETSFFLVKLSEKVGF